MNFSQCVATAIIVIAVFFGIAFVQQKLQLLEQQTKPAQSTKTIPQQVETTHQDTLFIEVYDNIEWPADSWSRHRFAVVKFHGGRIDDIFYYDELFNDINIHTGVPSRTLKAFEEYRQKLSKTVGHEVFLIIEMKTGPYIEF